MLWHESRARNILRSDFNFEELGIGGLGKEFSDIFRRFAGPGSAPCCGVTLRRQIEA